MDTNHVEHLLYLVGSISGLTIVGALAVLKTCDWLIGLKYKSKDECSKTRHEWAEKMQHDYASREGFENLKESMHEIKDQNTKILDILVKSDED